MWALSVGSGCVSLKRHRAYDEVGHRLRGGVRRGVVSHHVEPSASAATVE